MFLQVKDNSLLQEISKSWN